MAANVNARLDVAMLPAFVSAASVGLYSVATNISLIVYALSNTFSGIVLPDAARDPERGPAKVIGSLYATLAIAGVLAVALGVFARPLLEVVYGSSFADAAEPLVLLLPGAVLFAGSSIVSAGVYAAGRPFTATAAQLAGMAVTIAGLLVFLKRGGGGDRRGARLQRRLRHGVRRDAGRLQERDRHALALVRPDRRTAARACAMTADVAALLGWYTRERRDLPWRRTREPYRILVSEVMLQQTQASRVAPRYERFLGRFPDERALAEAPLAAVVAEWSGLGYNRRAAALRAAVQVVVRDGWPRGAAGLATLPGVGPYPPRWPPSPSANRLRRSTRTSAGSSGGSTGSPARRRRSSRGWTRSCRLAGPPSSTRR